MAGAGFKPRPIIFGVIPARGVHPASALFELLAPLAAIVIPLAVFLSSLPPFLAASDSAELTTAASTLGIPHPPGYPLYTLIGRAFAAVPVGDIPLRLNVMSAVIGTVAVLLVYGTVRDRTGHWPSALVAALALAFSYHFWAQSLVAEVYTLEAGLLAALLYLASRWERTRSERILWAAFLVLGLALAHRPTAVLLVPAIAGWLAVSGAPSAKELGRAILFVLPGLALYAYLPAASAFGSGYAWNAGYLSDGTPIYPDLTSGEGLFSYITARTFEDFSFAYSVGEQLHESTKFLGWLWQDYFGVGIVLAAVGVVYAWRTCRPFAQLTIACLLLHSWFFVNYGVGDKDQMFLPAYVIIAIWIGIGVKGLIDLAQSRAPWNPAVLAAYALAVAVPVVLFAVNHSAVTYQGSDQVEVRAKQVMTDAPQGALIVGYWSDVTPLEYYQWVEGERPDLMLVSQWSLTSADLVRLLENNVDDRPILLLWDPGDSLAGFTARESDAGFALVRDEEAH